MPTDFETLKSFLVRTPFFGGLDDFALDRVARMLKERDYEQGAVVFREGETGRAMYIIESGEVVMTCAGDSGMQVKLVRFGPGDFFGDMTLIEMHPRSTTASVAVAARLFELTNMDLYRLYKDDIKAYVLVLQNMNRELCRRLRRADMRITAVADEAGDERTQIRLAPVRPARCPPER